MSKPEVRARLRSIFNAEYASTMYYSGWEMVNIIDEASELHRLKRDLETLISDAGHIDRDRLFLIMQWGGVKYCSGGSDGP